MTGSRDELTPDERLRRCLLLCCHFARNLAYYRARRANGALAKRADDFWTSADVNFLDMAVLEWCKLFGDSRAHHAWQRVVSDPKAFEQRLLVDLEVTLVEFQTYVASMRLYRDRFLAHLDSDKIMDIPKLDLAQKAVWFYYGHVWEQEIDPQWRSDAPDDIGLFYDARFADGVKAYAG